MSTQLETIQKIYELSTKKDGWFFGEGFAAKNKTIDNSLLIVEFLHKNLFSSTEVFLSSGGQIQVNGYLKQNKIKIVVDEDTFYLLLIEKGNKPELIENMDIDSVYDIILKWGFLWVISEYSIQSTTVKKLENLNQVLSYPQHQMKYQYLIQPAFEAKTGVHVATYEDSIQVSLGQTLSYC